MNKLFVAAAAALVGVSAQAADVNLVFDESADSTAGTYQVRVEITGSDTSGMSSYNIQAQGLSNAAGVTFTQAPLGALAQAGFVGFSPTPLAAPVGTDQYSAANSQFQSANPVFGIGISPQTVVGAFGNVDIAVPAVIGDLEVGESLTAANFAPSNVGLFDDSQNSGSVLGAGDINVNISVIPIPEPTTLGLAGIAGTALLRRRRA